MESIVNYFGNIPSAHRLYIMAGGITIFWMIEGILPLFKMEYNKWKHAGINIFFTVTTIIVNFMLAILLLKSSQWMEATHFGILQWIPMSALMMVLVGLPLMDLIGAYLVHWVEHRVPFMWRFHLVHHTDTHVDTTTANRHHPGESVFRFLFTMAAVVIVGAPMWLVMLYQALSAALSQFNHANIVLPRWLDNAISWVIVSPDMHKVHHHHVLPYTDTNFGNIFAIWDRLFGTFATMERSELIYGIDTHPDKHEHSNIINLLKIPFQPYRAPTIGKSEKK
jgi:sterol desaturase/sphingolipid hydroxylase (fatty acid hydroxylase superfamily)